MKKKTGLEKKVKTHTEEDPLLDEVYDYLNKFDFPLAYVLQKKFKIGFSRAEKILRQLEARKNRNK